MKYAIAAYIFAAQVITGYWMNDDPLAPWDPQWLLSRLLLVACWVALADLVDRWWGGGATTTCPAAEASAAARSPSPAAPA